MAFDSLTEKLQNVFKNLRGKGRLTEDDVKVMYELKRRRKGMKKEVRLKRVDYPYVHFELVDDGQNLVDSSDENLQNEQSQQHTNSSPSNSKSILQVSSFSHTILLKLIVSKPFINFVLF